MLSNSGLIDWYWSTSTPPGGGGGGQGHTSVSVCSSLMLWPPYCSCSGLYNFRHAPMGSAPYCNQGWTNLTSVTQREGGLEGEEEEVGCLVRSSTMALCLECFKHTEEVL